MENTPEVWWPGVYNTKLMEFNMEISYTRYCVSCFVCITNPQSNCVEDYVRGKEWKLPEVMTLFNGKCHLQPSSVWIQRDDKSHIMCSIWTYLLDHFFLMSLIEYMYMRVCLWCLCVFLCASMFLCKIVHMNINIMAHIGRLLDNLTFWP